MLFRRFTPTVRVSAVVAGVATRLGSTTSNNAVATTDATASAVASPSSSSSTSTAASSSSTSNSASSTTDTSSHRHHKKNHVVVTSTILHPGDSPKVVKIDLSADDEGAVPRLGQYTEQKPFVTPRQIRDFSFSLAIGLGVMAGVHYVVSSSVAESYEEEVAIIRRVTKDAEEEAEALPEKPAIPQFVAPSSYSGLKKKMEEEQRIARERFLADENKKETPVLHQEFMQRVMMAWNRSLSNVESSAAAWTVQYHSWRVRQMKKKLKSMLEADGKHVVEIKELA